MDIAVLWRATASENETVARMAGVCGLARTNDRRGNAQLSTSAPRRGRAYDASFTPESRSALRPEGQSRARIERGEPSQ